MSESQSAPLPADVASVLQSLVQQQAALLQIHAESVRLQRLLVERCLSVPDSLPSPLPVSAGPPPSSSAAAATGPPVLSPSASVEPVAAPAALPAAAPQVPLAGISASRAARYYQQRPSLVAPLPALNPRDLELMRRLHEISDASSLILQFGPFKGATLGQVAVHNPEYIRRLVNRAERPEVRAAACRLVSALEATEEHTPRASRGAGRRAAGSRAGPRG